MAMLTALLIAALAACGSEELPPGKTRLSPTATQEPTASASGPTTPAETEQAGTRTTGSAPASTAAARRPATTQPPGETGTPAPGPGPQATRAATEEEAPSAATPVAATLPTETPPDTANQHPLLFNEVRYSPWSPGKDPWGNALMNGSVDDVRRLLERHDDRTQHYVQNERDPKYAIAGIGPLHLAAAFNPDPAVTALMLKETYDADWTVSDLHDMSALTLTAQLRGDTDTAVLLLEAGADVDRRWNTNTPAVLAATHNEAMARLFLAWGSTTPLWHENQGSILMAAAQNPDTDFFKAILAEAQAAGNAPDFAKDMKGLISTATRNPSTETLEYLITVNQQGPEALTAALHYVAIGIGNAQALPLLIEAGADITAVYHGQSALHMAASSSRPHHDALSILLEAGIPADVRDDSKRTPLHHAMRATCARDAGPYERQFLRILLEAGADPNSQDSLGNTPLHLTSNTATCWDIMFESGADPGIANTDGESVFVQADTVQLRMIAEHAPSFSMDTKDFNGDTRLHMAVQREQSSLIELLLELGADRKATNARGETPCQLARREGSLHGKPALAELCRP